MSTDVRAHYFFDAYDGDGLFADAAGIASLSQVEMKHEALRILLELAHANIGSEETLRTLRIVAREATGECRADMTLAFTSPGEVKTER